MGATVEVIVKRRFGRDERKVAQRRAARPCVPSSIRNVRPARIATSGVVSAAARMAGVARVRGI